MFFFEEKSEYKRVNLENRLIDFALKLNDILVTLPNDDFAKNLKGQLVRSSASPSFNYGEAQSAESRKDFIHKMQICLKELRETFVGIKIIEGARYQVPDNLFPWLKNENNQLISIFVKSIETARKNNQ
ncbi:MAG: four helix bundle protein [Bacteroidetes bacterium]|nr:four helix bundle protein [Bacteroidota bacterium]